MFYLIDILLCMMEGVFQIKSRLCVIAQEINRINGGLVLKPKLLCVKIKNNIHMRIIHNTFRNTLLLALLWSCALSGLVNIYKRKPFTLARSGTTSMFTKVKFFLMFLLHRHLYFMNFIKSVKTHLQLHCNSLH